MVGNPQPDELIVKPLLGAKKLLLCVNGSAGSNPVGSY